MYNETDSATWAAFQRGEVAAFERLYQQYVRLLLAYGRRMTADEETVRDAVQTLFGELWRSRANLAATDNVKIYLLRALRYKLQRQHRTPTLLLREWPEPTETQPSPEAIWLANEAEDAQIAAMRRVIAQLPIRQQEVLHLRYFQQCSTEETANIMGIQYQSVANLLHKALTFLKQHLQQALTLLGTVAWNADLL